MGATKVLKQGILKNSQKSTLKFCSSAENRAKFDVTAGWEYIDRMEGTDYGHEIVLTGVLDTLDGNDICADTEAEMCMTTDHWEMAFHLIGNLSESATRVFKPAMMVPNGQ